MTQTISNKGLGALFGQSYGDQVINRSRADLIRRIFNRSIKWLKLLKVSLSAFKRYLPWLSLILDTVGIAIRGVTALTKPTLSKTESVLYLLLLLVLSTFAIESFVTSGFFSFTCMAITAASVRVVIDGIEAYSNYRQLTIDKSVLNERLKTLKIANLPTAGLGALQQQLLIKQAMVARVTIDSTLVGPTIIHTVNQHYQAQLTLVQAALKAQNKCDTSQLRFNLCLASFAFNIANTALITTTLLLCLVNPIVGLALFIATECVEIIAIGCLGYNLWARTHPTAIIESLNEDTLANKTLTSSYQQLQKKLGSANGEGLSSQSSDAETEEADEKETLLSLIDTHVTPEVCYQLMK